MSKSSPQFDALTRELREAGWMPPRDMPCGCNRNRLCEGHTVLRAVEHYQPGTIR